MVVIPAKAGIPSFQAFLDPGFRRGDGVRNLIVFKLTALGPTAISNKTFKDHFSSKHEKRPKVIAGLDGIYSMKRLSENI